MSCTVRVDAALDLLLGAQAADALAAAVGSYGADLNALRVADVHVAPTGGVRVRYTADVRRADGSPRSEVLVAATGDHIPPGAAVLVGSHRDVPVEVGVWRWPQDPALPGLAAACHPGWLAAMLAGIGEALTTPPRVAVRTYRPGQRAVLEVSATTGEGPSRWYVKVVRPDTIADLRRRHELLGSVLPVPSVLASTDDGILVLPQASGTLLRQLVSHDQPDQALPHPAELQALLDLLPTELLQLPARRTHLQRFEQSVTVLQLTTSWRAPEVALPHGLAAVVDGLRSAAVDHESSTVPVHGDFHIGQLLVADGDVSAVIDVDTAGPGERVDEWATLLGHLSVVALTNPTAGRYSAAVLSYADRHVNPEKLRLHTAAAILGLATGPFRSQHPQWRQWTAARVDAAQRWLSAMRDHSSTAPASLMCTRDS